MSKRPTLIDLARELGLSKTTVSFVLNGKGEEKKISQATQDRVYELVERLSYQPSSSARSLRLGRTYALGLIVPDISNPFFGEIARILESIAAQSGFHVVIGNTGELLEKEANVVASMCRQSVDGIILVSSDVYSTHVRGLIEDRFPLVLLDRIGNRERLKVDSVSVENQYGMKEITSHLIANGCRRIGLFTLTNSLHPILDRIEGYKEALLDQGMPIDEELIFDVDYRNLKNGIVERLDKLFSLEDPIDGIAFANNLLAAHGIWAANIHYKDRVGSMLFASFDDLELFDYCIPPVSSVRQPCREIVESAFRMIRKRIETPKCPYENLILGGEIVLR